MAARPPPGEGRGDGEGENGLAGLGGSESAGSGEPATAGLAAEDWPCSVAPTVMCGFGWGEGDGWAEVSCSAAKAADGDCCS